MPLVTDGSLLSEYDPTFIQEGGGLFHPDHKGRYGPSADMLTEAQAQLVEAEVWFCADWSLRNICMLEVYACVSRICNGHEYLPAPYYHSRTSIVYFHMLTFPTTPPFYARSHDATGCRAASF